MAEDVTLFALPEHARDDNPPWPGQLPRRWRWALVRNSGLGVCEQVSFDEGQTWRGINHYAHASLQGRFRVAWNAAYYDGEHRALSLGFVVINWGW